MNIKKSIFYLLLFSGLAACSNGKEANSSIRPLGQQIQLKLNGLESMNGQHYEGWAIGPSGVTSTGRFNIDDQNRIVSVNVDGNVVAVLSDSDIATFSTVDRSNTIKAFVLTIEPNGDTDAGPSSVHYLDGSLTDGAGIATLQNTGAIGSSFTAAAGSYILATPTNGPATHDQGIWFLDAGSPSLTLPTIAENSFTYEGWVVNTSTGEVISTGTFNTGNEVDSDGPGASAGPNPAPAFPGQDFITPARDLNNGNYITVISVEPVPDFDPAPFTLKILRGDIALNAPVTTSIPLQNISNENDISIEVTPL